MNFFEYETEIRQALETADSIAWDSCHKIYILADSEQTDLMKSYGYTELWTKDQMDSDWLFHTIQEWWRLSCSLRFIDLIETEDYNEPKFRFTSLIPQH